MHRKKVSRGEKQRRDPLNHITTPLPKAPKCSARVWTPCLAGAGRKIIEVEGKRGSAHTNLNSCRCETKLVPTCSSVDFANLSRDFEIPIDQNPAASGIANNTPEWDPSVRRSQSPWETDKEIKVVTRVNEGRRPRLNPGCD